MTVVPLSFQLTAWIPAWWQGRVGGDDLADLTGMPLLPQLRAAQSVTVGLSAYCPALGVGVLPGPKPVTEIAVAAGEAVILHGGAGAAAHLLVPREGRWSLLQAGPSRPLDINPGQADRDLAEAVVTAEHALRESGTQVSAIPRRPSVRPLPPDAGRAEQGLLARAATLWTAVDAVPPARRTPALTHVLQCAARAVLVAYEVAGQPSSTQRRYA